MKKRVSNRKSEESERYEPVRFRRAAAFVGYIRKMENQGWVLDPLRLRMRGEEWGRRRWLLIRAILGTSKGVRDLQRYAFEAAQERTVLDEWRTLYNECFRYYDKYKDSVEPNGRAVKWIELKEALYSFRNVGKQMTFDFDALGANNPAQKFSEGERGPSRAEAGFMFKRVRGVQRNYEAEEELRRQAEEFF